MFNSIVFRTVMATKEQPVAHAYDVTRYVHLCEFGLKFTNAILDILCNVSVWGLLFVREIAIWTVKGRVSELRTKTTTSFSSSENFSNRNVRHFKSGKMRHPFITELNTFTPEILTSSFVENLSAN